MSSLPSLLEQFQLLPDIEDVDLSGTTLRLGNILGGRARGRRRRRGGLPPPGLRGGGGTGLTADPGNRFLPGSNLPRRPLGSILGPDSPGAARRLAEFNQTGGIFAGGGRGGGRGGGGRRGSRGRFDGSGGLLGNLAGEFQRAQEAANRANLERFEQVKGGFENRFNRGMANLQGLGQQELADIDQSFEELQAQQLANLTQRGLSGSTIPAVLQQGIARERGRTRGSTLDRLRQQRLSLDADLSGDLLGFIERREDTGPDFGQLITLGRELGRSRDGRLGGSRLGSVGGAVSRARAMQIGQGLQDQFNPNNLLQFLQSIQSPGGVQPRRRRSGSPRQRRRTEAEQRIARVQARRMLEG